MTPLDFCVSVVILGAIAVTMLLVWISGKLRRRPWIAFLVASAASGALLATWTALSIWVVSGPESSTMHGMPLRQFLVVYEYVGFPATIYGAIVGLLPCAGALLWHGDKLGSARVMLSLLLLLIGCLLLSVGLGLSFIVLGLWSTG